MAAEQLSLLSIAPAPSAAVEAVVRWRLAVWPSPVLPGGLAWRVEATGHGRADHRMGVGGLDVVSAQGVPAFYLSQIGAPLDVLEAHAARLGLRVPGPWYLLHEGREFLQRFPEPGEAPAEAWSEWSAVHP